jgi:lipid-binding SYLF domain-containing protein
MNLRMRRAFRPLVLSAMVLTLTGLYLLPLFADSAKEIEQNSITALNTLYASNAEIKKLGDNAKGILVFPKITKAGFIVGGQGGEGALLKQGKAVAYYKTGAASVGLQAGVQSYGYAMFFMDDESLQYLEKSDGWEIGSGPSVVVGDSGFGKTVSSSTIKKGIYAFIFGQKGLMAGIGLQGQKITKSNPK